MSLSSLLQAKKKDLKHCNTIVTNMLGEKYKIIDNEVKLIDKGLPFVVDTKPDLQVALAAPRLYFGSQDPVVNIDILQRYKIRHVISIGITVEVRFKEICYYSVDLLDVPESSIFNTLKTCFSIIKSNQHENIFVHCNAGVSRSASVIIAYLMVTENLSYDKAYQRVKSVRQCIKPNDGFVRQLKALKISDFSSV
ncbi:dual specificity protein phosphatase 19 [Athalia rosae]|uniref:dual specificity protein phosphatase 19 n=1 Tax=Athalia rosae TaxID=37344 RepID=UPI0020349224|nr:dual specificity protein phosphatase 19 [Athalia rosae]